MSGAGARWLLLTLLGASSCRQLLEIEDAELAPNVGGSTVSSGGSSSRLLLDGGEGGVTLGTDSSSAGQGGDAAAGDGSESPSLCDRYCAAVADSCTGAFAVYTSLTTCRAVCKALPQGQAGDTRGNSVECRLHAALVAKDEPSHYCSGAGPGGDGVCGDDCESLCTVRASVCAAFVATDEATCSNECARLPELDRYSTDVSAGQYGGPHVQCRLYHVSAAAADDAEQHCAHVDGAAPCN